jgi:hypothetical protein
MATMSILTNVCDAKETLAAFQSVIFAFGSIKHTAINDHNYDSSSFLIAVDNCSSRCITNDPSDFIGTPMQSKTVIKGIGGTVKASLVGTVRWTILDDDGKMHTWDIPNTYYNASSPYRLLSPQHWAQSCHDGHGTWAATYDDSVELFWKGNRFCRTVLLDPASNIAVIQSAPSFQEGLHAFCQAVLGTEAPIDEQHLLAMPVVSDDDDSNSEDVDESDKEPPQSQLHPDLPEGVITEDLRMTMQDRKTAYLRHEPGH